MNGKVTTAPERTVAARWSEDVVARGFVAVPSLLLRHAPALGLNSLDVHLLLLLEMHRWSPDSSVYPSMERLAELSGRSVPTVKRRVAALSRLGLIAAHRRRLPSGRYTTSEYSVAGLVRRLHELAQNEWEDHQGSDTRDQNQGSPVIYGPGITSDLTEAEEVVEVEERKEKQAKYNASGSLAASSLLSSTNGRQSGRAPMDSTGQQEAVLDAFRYWKAKMGRDGALLTPKRRKRIETRLREGYTVDRIRTAVDGCAGSDWHQGNNDHRRAFDDIELICRDGEHLESFEQLATRGEYGSTKHFIERLNARNSLGEESESF